MTDSIHDGQIVAVKLEPEDQHFGEAECESVAGDCSDNDLVGYSSDIEIKEELERVSSCGSPGDPSYKFETEDNLSDTVESDGNCQSPATIEGDPLKLEDEAAVSGQDVGPDSDTSMEAYIAYCQTGDKQYQCTICEKTFYQKLTLDLHMQAHAKEDLLTCSVCGKRVSGSSTGVRLDIGESLYKCNVCGANYHYELLLNFHKKTHTEKPSFKCKACEKKCKAYEAKKHGCELCEERFSTLSDLTDHFQQHKQQQSSAREERPVVRRSGEKKKPKQRVKCTPVLRHVCKVCKENFSTLARLAAHLKKHSGKKQLKCNICRKSYLRKICLIKHLKKSHSDIDV